MINDLFLKKQTIFFVLCLPIKPTHDKYSKNFGITRTKFEKDKRSIIF